MASYSGFWGMQTGDALAELADLLSWNKDDWINFERWLDELEKKQRSNKQKKTRRIVRQQLHQLKYRGAVEAQQVGEDTYVRLTEPGWWKAKSQQIRAITTPCMGGFCIVVFDIPESHREARDSFRRFLKTCGFEQLQRSVWVHRKAVTELVCAAVNELDIVPWVTVAEGVLSTTAFL